MSRLLKRQAAAHYLGMSERSFDGRAADALPYIPLGRCRLYDVKDLDAWVDAQTKILPVNSGKGESEWADNNGRAGSSSAAQSGTSTSRSASGKRVASFENRLAQARSRQRPGS